MLDAPDLINFVSGAVRVITFNKKTAMNDAEVTNFASLRQNDLSYYLVIHLVSMKSGAIFKASRVGSLLTREQ